MNKTALIFILLAVAVLTFACVSVLSINKVEKQCNDHYKDLRDSINRKNAPVSLNESYINNLYIPS